MTGEKNGSAGEQDLEKPAYSIVIRAYNEEQHLPRLLEGILHQEASDASPDQKPGEIILVDSGSTDGTLGIASRYPVRVVNIQPEDFTFGRSLNLGISHARSDLVVIASAHVYPVYPDWLEKLLAPFADPQVALVYGKQRGGTDAKFSEQQIFARWYPDHSDLRQRQPFCNNANAAIRRVIWQQHPYDETLTGLEDLEWANWAVRQGYVIAYCAEAEIIHVHDETPRAVYNRYRREGMAFKRIFPLERFDLFDLAGMVTTNIASDAWHAAHQHKLWSSLINIFWFRWMQFWGTYQGYRRSGPLTWHLRQTFYYPHSLDHPLPPSKRDVKPIEYPRAE